VDLVDEGLALTVVALAGSGLGSAAPLQIIKMYAGRIPGSYPKACLGIRAAPEPPLLQSVSPCSGGTATPSSIVAGGPHRSRLHVHHVIPWARGGRTELSNLRTACSVCNLGKSDSDAHAT
jgi:hypothetical protein